MLKQHSKKATWYELGILSFICLLPFERLGTSLSIPSHKTYPMGHCTAFTTLRPLSLCHNCTAAPFEPEQSNKSITQVARI